MHRLFALLTCFIIIAGVSGGREMMKVKKKEDFTLKVKTLMTYIRRLTVKKDGQVNFRNCSQERGCKEINSRSVSLQSSEGSVNLTFPEADEGDEGTYEVELIDKEGSVNTTTFNVTLIEQPFSTTSPTPQSIAVTGDNKGAIIIGCICILGVIVCGVGVLICCNWKKINEYFNNRKARDVDFEQGKPLRPVSGGESIKMDKTKCSVDNNNQHSTEPTEHCDLS